MQGVIRRSAAEQGDPQAARACFAVFSSSCGGLCCNLTAFGYSYHHCVLYQVGAVAGLERRRNNSDAQSDMETATLLEKSTDAVVSMGRSWVFALTGR